MQFKEPSLGIYTQVLNIFYPSNNIGIKTGIFDQVLDEVEKMDNSPDGLEIIHPADVRFFTTAMIKCQNGADMFKYAPRIHKILMRKNNLKLLTSDYYHSLYL